MSTLAEQNGHPFDYQDPLSGRGVITGRRTGEARTGDDLDTEVADDPDAIICCPREAWGDGTHDPGCRLASRATGPATSADLLELDAVPEPVDSDAPGARCPVHGRAGFCNEIAWFADGALPDEYPTREDVEQALRDRHIDLSEVRLSTAKCGWTP